MNAGAVSFLSRTGKLLAFAVFACLILTGPAHAFAHKPATAASSGPTHWNDNDLAAETQIGLFRFYDPNLQRWLNQDPLGERGRINLYGFVGIDPINWIDPFGLYVGIDDAVFSGGGALVGLGAQLLGDLISSLRCRSWRFSAWEDYVGSAIGGAAGGEALLYTGPIGAGLIGGATGNLAKQGLKNISGKQSGFDPTSFGVESSIGAATGFVLGLKVAPITAGQGSYNQVYKQIVTKAQNGTISSVTPQTAAKMFTGRAFDTGLLPGTGAAAAAAGSGFLPSSEERRPRR